jgi:hypothetical protein
VQAGHTEIKRKEKLRVCIGGDIGARLELEGKAGDVVLYVLGVILDRLHAEKDAAQDQREREKKSDELSLSNLSAPHGHGHGQAAGDQDHCIEAAKPQVQTLAALSEYARIGMPVNGVSEEEAAKEQNLGGQKDPHAESGRFLLLLHRLKMSVQFFRAMHSVLLFSSA